MTSKKTFTISAELLNRKTRKHQKKTGWRRIYYYTNKHEKKLIRKNQVSDQDIGMIHDIKELRKDTFYKMANLSKKDANFNYYKCIKPEITGDIYIHKEPRTSTENNSYNKKMYKNVKTTFKYAEDGQIIVDFS